MRNIQRNSNYIRWPEKHRPDSAGHCQKSTSDMLVVVESPAGMLANISSLSLTCNGAVVQSVPIPNGVAASNAGSFRAAFQVPAIIGAATDTCNLQFQDVAGKTVKGQVNVAYYAEQKAVLSDGTVAEVAFDSTPNGNNAAKYQDTYTSNFCLQ